MEINELLKSINAPDVKLEDIIVRDITQERLIARLVTDGITDIEQLYQMSDKEIKKLDLMGKKKLEKLSVLLTDWQEDNFPVKLRVIPSKPETVLESMKRDVFHSERNALILAMRLDYKTYEEIGDALDKTRQNIHAIEKRTLNKFKVWYEENRIEDKIGSYDDLQLYCEKNFPTEETFLKAVRKVVRMAKYKKYKK